MNLCSDGHEEVCYEVRDCPACKSLTDATNWEKQYDDAKRDIDGLEDQISSLQGELAEEREKQS
jgi:hypothetical protein